MIVCVCARARSQGVTFLLLLLLMLLYVLLVCKRPTTTSLSIVRAAPKRRVTMLCLRRVEICIDSIRARLSWSIVDLLATDISVPILGLTPPQSLLFIVSEMLIVPALAWQKGRKQIPERQEEEPDDR